jgi:DNA-binding transcriptional MerR regulator
VVRNDDRCRVYEFAERAGVTVKTLHHYDRVGLLRPQRTRAGYRVYTSSDLVRLEQILALKTIGVSLKDIRALLDRDGLPLPAIFRQQREVLEEKRRLLDRTIDGLVGDWPSPAWQSLYRDINAAIGSDPAAPLAQTLADRWQTLTKEGASTPAIRTGMIKAWADREQWPPSLKRRMQEFDIERANAFIAEALWVRWANEQDARRRQGGPGIPRATDSRRALFDQWRAILDADPASGEAQALLERWQTLLEVESNGDEEVKADMAASMQRRHSWPPGMRRYIASLYDTDAETWLRVTDFIERALACKRSGETPSPPGALSSPRCGASA